MLSTRDWIAAGLIAASVLAVSRPIGAAAAGEPLVVLCHDAERDLVQAKLRHACDGAAVTEAEAAEIRDRARRARARALHAAGSGTPPVGQGDASGSGVVVSAHGHVVTAVHVVDRCRSLAVHLAPGTPPVMGTMLARARQADLALLRVAAPTPQRVALAPSWNAVAGTGVVAAGHPAQGLVTIRAIRVPGTVLGLHRHDAWPAARLLLRMAIRQGHSGGPLFASDGRLVGIVVAKADTPEIYRRTGSLVTDIAVAEPLSAVRDLLGRIETAQLHGAPPARDLAEAMAAVVRISCVRAGSGR